VTPIHVRDSAKTRGGGKKGKERNWQQRAGDFEECEYHGAVVIGTKRENGCNGPGTIVTFRLLLRASGEAGDRWTGRKRKELRNAKISFGMFALGELLVKLRSNGCGGFALQEGK